ncbi:MAG: adenylate/guanylate cyclase domain-containing protein [Magnetococcales bacterium]|nr:adenylate/guanylate cyclase domain-containing protein [Magnetococcales bacterium]
MAMRENRNLSIMFADIAGSTRLYESFGDAKARELTSRCIELLTAITNEYSGRVIKTIGDEVMCTFPSADLAADASVRMQEEVNNQSPAWGHPLNIRIGFHFGEVIQEGGDVFGDAVNLAARMAAQAKADQIMTTGETKEQMNRMLQMDTRLIITTRVKGKANPVEIYELTWGEEEELTIMGGPGFPAAVVQEAPVAPQVMKVTFQGRVLDVGQELPSITLGRGKQNHFMVPDTMASRLHAKIEFRRGRFMLVDQSTNGTFVHTKEGENLVIHRDEHVIQGEGVIGMGRKVTPNDPLSIHFSME